MEVTDGYFNKITYLEEKVAEHDSTLATSSKLTMFNNERLMSMFQLYLWYLDSTYLKMPHSAALPVVENGVHIVSCFQKMLERGPKPESNVRSLEGHWLLSRTGKRISSLPISLEVENTLVLPILWLSVLSIFSKIHQRSSINFRIHHFGLGFMTVMLKINFIGSMNLHWQTIPTGITTNPHQM